MAAGRVSSCEGAEEEECRGRGCNAGGVPPAVVPELQSGRAVCTHGPGAAYPASRVLYPASAPALAWMVEWEAAV